jgi:THAP domain-containing protein 4
MSVYSESWHWRVNQWIQDYSFIEGFPLNDQSINIQILDQLEGTWEGQGRGYFPGVTAFDTRVTLVFTRRDEKTLAYRQQAQKLYDGQIEWLQSHWESGFISLLENGDLQLVDIQIGGRSEILVGSMEAIDNLFRIHFVSKTLNNDPRMVSSARTFALQGNILRYDMEMQTTKVDQSTPHLDIVLQRINYSNES